MAPGALACRAAMVRSVALLGRWVEVEVVQGRGSEPPTLLWSCNGWKRRLGWFEVSHGEHGPSHTRARDHARARVYTLST